MVKLAVLGAGLFGSTTAILAARAGHEVHMFEAKRSLMCGATAGTYARVHKGFHYPRSGSTGSESRKAEASFRAEYGSAVIDSGRQFYIVPPHDNHVSVEEYRTFLDDEGLAFSEEGGVFEVKEPRVNLSALQVLVRQKVEDAGVKVHLGMRAPSIASGTARLREQFDHIVVATYSGLNDTLGALGCEPAEYKFQVVEKPVVLLPQGFKDTSMVVIDGPFGCLDPLDDTPLHVLGHVVETVHAENVGFRAGVPKHLAPLIDQGLIRNPSVTKFEKVVEGLARFVPGVERAVHLGSHFVVRSVLAHQESTDSRPTLVNRIDRQVTTIFSGKLGTCVASARAICDSLVAENQRVAA